MFNIFKKTDIKYDLFNYPKNLPILISSQLQRCGGSLFSQLFDNHPNVLAHPWEVMVYKEGRNNLHAKILKTKKEFKRLTIDGYKKGKHAKKKHRFFFLYERFAKNLFNINENDKKHFFDFYFDEFFKYWINYKCDKSEKKMITGFSPFFCNNELLSTVKENKRLNIIHIYRDPVSWWASAKHFKEKYKNIMAVETFWKKSQEEILEAKKKFPKRVYIVNFNDLIKKRKKVMLYLCKKFFLQFNKTLMTPTFNGDKIENDSTFKNQKTDKFGIIKDISKKRSQLVTQYEKQKIQFMTSNIEKKVSRLSVKIK